jgi:hypothetical protein
MTMIRMPTRTLPTIDLSRSCDPAAGREEFQADLRLPARGRRIMAVAASLIPTSSGPPG